MVDEVECKRTVSEISVVTFEGCQHGSHHREGADAAEEHRSGDTLGES